jgi:methyltransferase (TIGR00027 family)
MGKNKVKEGLKENLKEPNPTAELTASHRAAESLKPETERICDDPYAIHFLSLATLEIVKDPVKLKAFSQQVGPLAQAMGTLIRLRVRYFDDFLKKSLKEGLEQLVILGAGYDTRAYRIEGLKENVKVFEVDHPHTQHFKIEKIREIFGFTPEHVTYVPADLETQTLNQSLFSAGYNRSKKTLFLMEGLICYLTPETVDGILSFIVENSGKGSIVLFDYHEESVVNGTCEEGRILQKYFEQVGESFKFGIEEGKIEEFLLKRGFSDITNVSSEDYKINCFKEMNENMAVHNPLYFVNAIVSALQN